MPDNRVSASLSEADRQAVLAAVQTIRTKLPFLLDLTPDERHKLPKMGDKSRAFVEQALTIATQNEEILPRSFDVEEFRRDVELMDALRPVAAALAQLYELVDDTLLEVSSEAYVAALYVYQLARAAGKGSALDGLLEGMSQRFARKTRPAKETPTT